MVFYLYIRVLVEFFTYIVGIRFLHVHTVLSGFTYIYFSRIILEKI